MTFPNTLEHKRQVVFLTHKSSGMNRKADAKEPPCINTTRTKLIPRPRKQSNKNPNRYRIIMDTCLLIVLSISLSAAALLLRLAAGGGHNKRRLPPGPSTIPFLINLLRLRGSVLGVEHLLHEFHSRYGPIVTLRFGRRPAIFIADRRLAHKALVEHGSSSSDRPAALLVRRFLSSNQHNISSAAYGPLWRLLRRNLISEILHPSRVTIYGAGRRWVLRVLRDRLLSGSAASTGGAVVVMESFQFAMFCLLVLMCFGEKLDEKSIREIEVAQRDLLLYATGKLNVFAFVPRFAQYVFREYVFRERWRTMVELRERQEELYVPLIRARREHKASKINQESDERYVYSYLDSLLDLKLPEDDGERSLTDGEIVTLCSEFLNAGTDTTSTALQWIMAELVKNQEVQRKLVEEIDSVVGSEEVREEDLPRMPYVRAVVMEGLRRHPPSHFVLPHAATEEMEIGGYAIPKGASVNFMVEVMNHDGEVWDEPREFRPERFLAGGKAERVDITGSREITMMPFGVGRRICPGLGLAMLHLDYFVANLVREFEWKGVEGEEVDMTEKMEFTVVMKNSLRARVISKRE